MSEQQQQQRIEEYSDCGDITQYIKKKQEQEIRNKERKEIEKSRTNCQRGSYVEDKEFYENAERGDDEYCAEVAMKSGNTRGYRSRHWCFTWNNYTADHNARLRALSGVLYMIYGYEVAPNTGTPHLQGYVYFENEQRFGAKLKNGKYHHRGLKGTIPEAYWKPMYSNPKACIKYCSKSPVPPIVYGTPPVGQGTHTELKQVCDAIVQGQLDMRGVAEQFPQQLVKYGRGLQTLMSYMQKYRDEQPFVMWFYGDSGCGKTGFAFINHKREDVYIKKDGSKYFEGYTQQPAVVINEFTMRSQSDMDGWKLQDFLQYIDKYPVMCEIKGSYVPFNSKFIYITSIRHPVYYFPKNEDYRQVLRRLRGVVHVVGHDEYVEDEDCIPYLYDPSKDMPLVGKLPTRLANAYTYNLTQAAKDAIERARIAKPTSSMDDGDDDDDTHTSYSDD